MVCEKYPRTHANEESKISRKHMSEYMRKLNVFFSHLRNGKKFEIPHFFKLVCIHSISIPRFIGTPRLARSNIAQKRCFRMTKFRNNAFSDALYRLFFIFFFFYFSFSLGFRASVRTVAHRRSRRGYLARGGLIWQTEIFSRRETKIQKICIKTVYLHRTMQNEIPGWEFRDGEWIDGVE